MLVYRTYTEAKDTAPYCITMGSFDGVHIGHKKLIEITIKKSEELNCKSMVYTFNRHPKKAIIPGVLPELITTEKSRMRIFEQTGLDSIYLEDFLKIKGINAQNFVEEILIKNFKVKCIVAGYNFRFGKNREGDIETLKSLGYKHGFSVIEVKPVIIMDKIVSSSLIRELIKSGEMEKARENLGRYFSITGTVIHGSKRGSKLGIRTANVEISKNIVMPKTGVYFTNTVCNGAVYGSVTNIGCNPTFNGDKISIETHIFDFEDTIYNSEIEIIFLKWRREEITFNCAKELKEQINRDIKDRLSFYP